LSIRRAQATFSVYGGRRSNDAAHNRDLLRTEASMPEDRDNEATWHVDAISWLKGGIIGSAEMALRFAELVLEHTQGTDELVKQRPLTVTDQGDTWRIDGRFQPAGGELELTPGSWRMIVKKNDAQIIDLGIPVTLKLSPEVQRRIDAAKRLKQEKRNTDCSGSR
jgi:hypothetical protein